MSKLPALTPDDPLRVVPAPQPETPTSPNDGKDAKDTPAPRRRRATRRPPPAPVLAPAPEQLAAPQTTSGEEWTGATDVTTFRLPAEVLQALHERSRHLGVAKGMTVAAALLDLFQRADDEIVEVVENTQQRYDSARRRARRAS